MANDIGPEWQIEHGIGETRALLIKGGEIIAAKLQWPGEIIAGQMHFAKLTSKIGGARRGVATLENGREILVDHLPPEATEGSTIGVRIVRAAIAERGRLKRAQGRCFKVGHSQEESMDETVGAPSDKSFLLSGTVRSLPSGEWEDVWHAASSGSIAFSGGEILCSVTPAMTVIDIDGSLPPRELALAAVPAIALALRWFEIGGSIGIDFPTLQTKADRRAVDEALSSTLSDWSHERTAMNGFGFVQLVARLEGPSLLHRFSTSRTAMCARYALSAAERTQGAGTTLLTVHPALKAKLKPEWLDELRRRTGRKVRIETDPSLALEAPSAQIISS